MLSLYEPNIKQLFSVALLLSIILAILTNNYLIIFVLITILFLTVFQNGFILVSLVLVYFLSFTGSQLVSNRSLLNIFALLLLSFLFIKKYGIDFYHYPKLPAGIYFIVSIAIIATTLSALVNGLQLNSIEAIVRLFIFFLLCYILYSFIENKNQMFYLLNTLFVIFLIVSGGVYFEIFNSGFALFGKTGLFARYSGFYESPNYIGVVVMITSSYIAILFFKNSLINKYYKFFLIFIFINVIAISILINSRASLLGLLISLSVILFFINKNLLLKYLIICCGLIIVALQVPEIKELIDLFLRLETIVERENLWSAGISMYSDFPIFGVGPDMFASHFFSYLPSSGYVITQSVLLGGKPHPHNFFLFLANENGVLGILLGITLFGLFFYYSFSAIKLTKNIDNDYYLLSVANLGIAAGFFIRTFSDAEGILSYGYITRDLPFWLIFIFSVFIYQKYHNSYNKNSFKKSC